MEETTITTAAPTQVGVESSITRLLDKVIDSMFSTNSKWTRSTLDSGKAGSVSHANKDQLKMTEGEVIALVKYSDGSGREFIPSIEVKTDKGICLANLQGSFELSKGDKVKLTSSTYPDKKGVNQPCLIVTEKV